MNTTNKAKAEQLGMPFGTASHRLRKLLMFKFAKELGYDKCFQCGYSIETAEELSIEHKKPWFNNDPELFWDLQNIAFSHMRCNRPNNPSHRPLAKCGGNGSAYRRGCRCTECKEAHRIRVKAQRRTA